MLKYSKIILFSATVLLFVACHSTKKIETPVLLQELTTFSANYSGKFNTAGEINTFNGQLRFEKGKELWLSVTKLGFEAIRFRMTNDSLYLLNKLDRTVMIRPVNFTQEFIGTSITLDELQNVFIGKHQFSNTESKILTATYDNLNNINGFILPEEIKIILRSFLNGELNIRYSKITVNQLIELPFQIPDNFEKI